jgi:C-terminal processing protease CtpA/Prc
MKRILIVLAVVAGLAGLVHAGEGHHRCTAGTQECLDKMVAHLQKSGYGGLEIRPDEAGEFSVTEVHPGSPGARIGVKVGDVLLSVNGEAVAEMGPEDHEAMQAELTPGSTHHFTVLRKGKKKSFSITLEKMPPEMIARYVGEHMMQHTDTEIASN